MCVIISWDGILDGIKIRRVAGHRPSAFCACCFECDVTSYVNLPSPWRCFHGGCTFQLWDSTNPFPLKLPLSGCFLTATRKETKTEALLESLDRLIAEIHSQIKPDCMQTCIQYAEVSSHDSWPWGTRTISETCHHQSKSRYQWVTGRRWRHTNSRRVQNIYFGKLNKLHQETS